ncbi:MAG: DNA primase [Aristaeellaceae bacterium]
MRFPPSWLDELRARADIVQIVGQYVPLKKNGRKYWGLCPFHGEKTASFSVDGESQLYYCFGCKAGGSVIQFVMDYERLDFQDAVRHLADQLHMPLPQMENDPDYQRRRTQRDRLLECNREAAKFFHQTLFTPAGQPSLAYLKRRGLTDGVIRKFGLGAAPDGWDTLTRHLQELGYTVEELKLAGLTVVREAEPATETSPMKPRRAFDMFRSRAIFPIIDQYGNVLAFGGRALGDQQPKYLNTSDTPVFNKRLGVYAANLLRKERHLQRVILVEGYMDVVALTQFGVPGVCATLGTALTSEQARLLKRFAPSVYLSYDGDSAGQHAILRGLDILEAEGVEARVLDFPDGLDPDEFIRRDGREAFDRLPALTPATYRMRRLRAEHDLSTQEGRTGYAKACAGILSRLEPVERENHLQELTVQTGFPREVLLEQIGLTAPAQLTPTAVQTAPKPRLNPRRDSPAATADERDEELLISLISTGRLPQDVASAEDFSDPLLRTLFTELSGGTSPATLVEMQPDEATRARVSRILLTPPSEDLNQLLRMAHECLSRNRLKRMQEQLNEIMRGLNALSPAEKPEALQRAKLLSERIKALKDAR